MTPVHNHTDDIYDPDEVGQYSPPFKPMKVNLEPSLSPPPTIPNLSESPKSSIAGSPRRKGLPRPKYHPSPGDAVLVSFMAGGKYQDVAREAAAQPLAGDNESEEPVKDKSGVAVRIEETGEVEDMEEDMEEEEEEGEGEGEGQEQENAIKKESDVEVEEEEAMQVVIEEETRPSGEELPPTDTEATTVQAGEQDNQVVEDTGLDLKALAARAMLASTYTQTSHAHTHTHTHTHTLSSPEESPKSASEADSASASKADFSKRVSVSVSDQMEGVKLTIPPIQSLDRIPENTTIKREGIGELPPIRHTSPQSGLSNGNGISQIRLPSISDQLGDINHLPEPPSASDSTFSQSPPGRPPPRFSAVPPGHPSPNSPNDTFRRELPSPGRAHFYSYANSHRRQSQGDGHQYTSPADYSSSNTETPSSDQSASTPATIGIDRMSIDGITNPQIGGFQCTYPGCTAQPFQTQYLLNSHANVHSSNRPHYCSVKGCPRSEGGKGFKRKNEMIRHGLVHDSPGYVCPFCPDREHKYPRPDNLQRHVRVHHVDKDKDDAQLREVLSQRPEGPSRGRRRRGGTG